MIIILLITFLKIFLIGATLGAIIWHTPRLYYLVYNNWLSEQEYKIPNST